MSKFWAQSSDSESESSSESENEKKTTGKIGGRYDMFDESSGMYVFIGFVN